MRKIFWVLPLILGLLVVPITISAQTSEIPSWVKGVANFWAEGNIDDNEFGEAISFLIEQEIIKVKIPQQTNNLELEHNVSQLESENIKLRLENVILKNKNYELESKLNNISQDKSITSKSTTNDFKLYDLLPSKNDLTSDWTILKSTESGNPTKDFYYVDAGQTKYNKNVKTIKTYRMNIFLFSSESLAKEAFTTKTHAIKDLIGYYIGNDYTVFFPEQLIMDSNGCAAIFKHTDETQSLEHVYGYCLVGKYLIYQDITGYYPNIHDDFVNMMNIAKSKSK